MSLDLFEAFRYRRKNTIIHALDPRTKLLFAIIISAIAIIFSEIIVLLALFLSILPLVFIAKSGREYAKSLKGTTFLVFIIFFFNFIFSTLTFAISMVLRIEILVTAFAIFFLTVHPDELSQALIQMKIPFSFAFAMSMAIRYVPTIALEAQSIREAQMSRGLELEKGNFIQKVKNFIPIIVPLIVNSVRRAISVAESLESRGFGFTDKRTYLFPLKLKKKDYVFLVFLFAILFISIYVRLFIGIPTFFDIFPLP
ncbi:MAG: energy-coupling factor transporter transmembrane component T family protein [Candidatus Odinarchaeia archaeon]